MSSLNGNGASESRRRELAAFLRSRRERLRPEQVGLPPSRRRRTPGLRREEVAQLAGVGVTWYTWLEQGRAINASPQVLDAIARTLRFDAHEHSHLFALAGVPRVTTIADECEALCPTARVLIDRLEPYPAAVLNSRWDVLAFNRAFASFYEELDTMAVENRNCLWLAFTNADWRQVMVDWDESVARMVAEYRAAMADHLDDPAWTSLVDRLHRASSKFSAVWERHDVRAVESRTKRALHPKLGLLTFDYTNLWLDQRLGIRIAAFTPANAQTAARLRGLEGSLEPRPAVAVV
jgi:transcriptional regulator with XRE-family HTH domain